MSMNERQVPLCTAMEKRDDPFMKKLPCSLELDKLCFYLEIINKVTVISASDGITIRYKSCTTERPFLYITI